MKNAPDIDRKEREMQDLIRTDVNRTCQEYEYFRRQETKDIMISLLFLWGKDHQGGYKQGMNELMAVILAVCYHESYDDTLGVFNPKFLQHDVYSIFCRILEIGLLELYNEGKDMVTMKQELSGSQDAKSKLFFAKKQPSRLSIARALDLEKEKVK